MGRKYQGDQLDLFAAASPIPEPAPPELRDCCAENCTRQVSPERLMCAQHWRLVPPALKALVMHTYRPGQVKDKNPSPDYLEAARRAIAAVAEAEKPPEAQRQFAVGDIVRVKPLNGQGYWHTVGTVQGYSQVGMVRLWLGSYPTYECSESRLERYQGTVRLWRLVFVTQCDRDTCIPNHSPQFFRCDRCDCDAIAQWNDEGPMEHPTTQHWPDCVFYVEGFNPNTREFDDES